MRRFRETHPPNVSKETTMSETPIFDQWAAEFFEQRKIRVESLYAPKPKPEPVQKVVPIVPKPGAVRKTMKGQRPIFRIEDEWPEMVQIDPMNHEWLSTHGEDPETLQDKAEKLSDETRLAFFAEVRTLFDKPVKTPYRTEKVEYDGEDTQPIDVTLLRTTKTLQHLE
jgi:hypothetical protein